MKQNKVVVITGSIATGKSAVTNILKTKGYEIIDADKISHEVLNFTSIKLQIEKNFGKEFISNGIVDRKKLSDYVFKNNKLEILNTIMHGAIFEEINKQIKKEKGLVFVDIPLYFEIEDKLKKYNFYADEVWLVYVGYELQLERLMSRDKISKEEAKIKIESQISIEEKKKRADVIINNQDTLEKLEIQINKLLKI